MIIILYFCIIILKHAVLKNLYFYTLNIIIFIGLVLLITVSCTKENTTTYSPGKGYYTVKDTDGNYYHSIIINNKEWMQENLKTTRLNNGDSIAFLKDPVKWRTTTKPAYCMYYNVDTNKNTYGLLYNWYAVNTHKLCPKGWHVPSDTVWTKLTDSLGGEKVAGGKLKEIGTWHWKVPNWGATNSTAFWALPGGARDNYGNFLGLMGTAGYWWSSTLWFYDFGYARYVTYNLANITRYQYKKANGFSVRCIKD
jgi:uncharacterized protein (TIGR02145 family)